MKLQGATVLVTGVGVGNLGHFFAQQLVLRGASKVYATARRPELIDVPGVEVLHLDLTDSVTVAEAAAVAADVDVLINNAAHFEAGSDLLHGDIEAMRRVFDTNVFGTLRVIREFAPVLARADSGGAILNVLSALSWSNFQGLNVYAASKAALWSMTNALREELAGQGTQVTSLVFGMAGTRSMNAFADQVAGKGVLEPVITAPELIVKAALDGLETGAPEVLGDQLALDAKTALSDAPRSVYNELAAKMLGAR
ncbi:short-chain dehydrogenase [Kineosporia sp. NBRC 101677]|uniref:SDR family NAD(P)-dependent oxidoreductase n=1 Tax=Kineosporia sp. NBRC 101677 TaxID=3032197 RepID=UPI0024A0607D|nr:SDR family NAD(P)-dependent oxidoreductase [Kineosporia sp. NBRC 101677]GLY16670.1 short-chain dehydrogenase [Kineosporia sp. NBRC 101677]